MNAPSTHGSVRTEPLVPDDDDRSQLIRALDLRVRLPGWEWDRYMSQDIHLFDVYHHWDANETADAALSAYHLMSDDGQYMISAFTPSIV
eukprot:2587351-Amphidinium_carterae.1